MQSSVVVTAGMESPLTAGTRTPSPTVAAAVDSDTRCCSTCGLCDSVRPCAFFTSILCTGTMEQHNVGLHERVGDWQISCMRCLTDSRAYGAIGRTLWRLVACALAILSALKASLHKALLLGHLYDVGHFVQTISDISNSSRDHIQSIGIVYFVLGGLLVCSSLATNVTRDSLAYLRRAVGRSNYAMKALGVA
eukprot:1641695-Pleurochrysis_carterae.AAC.7